MNIKKTLVQGFTQMEMDCHVLKHNTYLMRLAQNSMGVNHFLMQQ